MGCCHKRKTEKLFQELINPQSPCLNDNSNNTISINAGNAQGDFDFQNSIFKLSYSNFEPLKLIGRGSFGQVLLVRLKANKKLYAMKILDKKTLKQGKQQIHTKTERDLMVKINCPFIVNIKSAFQDETNLYIVSEFLQGGDLFFHLHEKRNVVFPEEKAKFYVIELVVALDFLHKNNMVYRDLKPENILLDSQGHVKLTDFGLSKIFENENDKAYTVCGTPQYLAPEILLRKGYDKAVDWWSLGCVMYEMIYGKLPFKFKYDTQPNLNIYKKKVMYPSWMEENAKDLIINLLTIEPDKRLGSGKNGEENIKRHPFFSDVDWDKALNKKLKPPFVPKIEDETDIKYFEKSLAESPIFSDSSSELMFKAEENEEEEEYDGFTFVAKSYKELKDMEKAEL